MIGVCSGTDQVPFGLSRRGAGGTLAGPSPVTVGPLPVRDDDELIVIGCLTTGCGGRPSGLMGSR
jgi:hypothetical protein